MKRVIVSALIFLVLVSAGAAAWTFVGATPAHAASGENGGGGAAAAAMRFVKLNPFMLPVVGKRRVEQFIGLSVALELNDPAQAGMVQENNPKLTDAFITDLYGAFEPSKLGETGLVKLDDVKSKLTLASNRVLGEGVVKDVLVQMISQRPVR